MEERSYHRMESPLGELLLEGDREALTGIWFADGRFVPHPACADGEGEPFRSAAAWLEAYFAGNAPEPDVIPVKLMGSPFQMLVWEELKRIPYGQVTTYGAIAKGLEEKLGRRVAAQAVGGAVGRNPVSILIPCHRVVGANGSLTGYGGGLWRKEFLLALEQKTKF